MLFKKKPLLEIIFLLVISAIVFLPNIGRLTYFKDDWYYIYDALIAGAKVFHPMFSIDRPARGYFFEIYYSLFGPAPFVYHVGAYIWRILAACGALWLFHILWPAQRRFVFFTALLFVLYPGYFWWISAVEYQPMIASLAFQVFSIALTLKAIQSASQISKALCLMGAIISGWIYIALVDYAIGMEAFRFLCVYVIVNRDARLTSVWNKLFATVKIWAWNILIPLGYLFWKIFLFDNERKATDIGLQLAGLFGSPISTITSWSLNFFSSILNLGVLAWVNQVPRYFLGMRLQDIASGLIVAGAVVLLVILVERLFEREVDSKGGAADISRKEALMIGVPGMLVGILPVILANRYINLDGFSHYALPASLAAAVGLMGFIYSLSSRRIQAVTLYALLLFATLAHYSISVSALGEERAIEKFWWQVSWRIPALRPGTMLVINYPYGNIGDDGNGVVEVPNMIYFPQPSDDIPVRYQVSALTLNNTNLQDVLAGKLYLERSYRSHAINIDYGNILVLSQPTPTSCVHIIDGRRPLISAFDPGNIMMVAPSSAIENVLINAAPFIPQEFAFGNEPEHAWCYYYEKAELAAQQEDWDMVVTLGETAIQKELHPEDQSEWLPFLLGYAITGDDLRVKQTAPKINTSKFLRLQACDLLTSIESSMTPQVEDLISTLYCKGQ